MRQSVLLAAIVIGGLTCTLTLHAQTPGSPSTNKSSEPSAPPRTPGYIPVFTPRNGAGNSNIFQSPAGQVGIATTSPGAQLDLVSSGLGIRSSSSSSGDAAIYGVTTDTSCFYEPCPAGVLGLATATVHDFGVEGVAQGNSGTGLAINNGAGVWGDTSTGLSAAISVLGTADENVAVAGFNNAEFSEAGEFIDYNSSGISVLYAAQAAGNGYCNIDASGDLQCSGTKSAVVNVPDHRKVALYAQESPQNWFEDFGSATLVAGSAVVSLDPGYLQTVNTEMEYHVFLTPDGDCRGLYVAQKTPTSFEVRELGGGSSHVPFDYRIVALRRGYESVRLADMTGISARLAATIPKLAGSR
jgi:hypothetical protein